jgi:hypothetical protein
MQYLRDAVDVVTSLPPSEEDAADFLGELRYLARKLDNPWGTGLYQAMLSETPAGQQGSGYETVEARECDRTYNTNGLLAAFADPRVGGISLQKLVNAGAVKLEWQWKKLQAAADRYNVTLAVAKHEIEDGDPEALVGEVWKSVVKVQARDQGPEVRT